MFRLKMLTFIAIISFYSLFSYEINFPLSEYKTPDYSSIALELFTNFSMYNHYDNRPNYYDGSEYEYKYENKSFSNCTNIDFSWKIDKSKLQREFVTDINFQPSYGKSYRYNEYDNDYKDHSYNTYLSTSQSFEFINKHFLKNNFFLGYDLDIYNYIRYRDDIRKEIESDTLYYHQDYKEKDYSFDINLPISFGYGRIYEVKDMRTALYILDELNEMDYLAYQPDRALIQEFAELITIVKNKRIFDDREKKKYELKEIDAFFSKHNLLRKNDINYFTVIFDNWLYASKQSRKSGFLISTGIKPLYDKEFDKDEAIDVIDNDNDTTSEQTETIKYFSTTNIEYEKPINRYFQFSFNSEIDVGYQKKYDFIDKELTSSLESPVLISDMNIAFGYYPNSRTNFNIDFDSFLRLEEGKIKYQNEEKIDFKNHLFSFSATISSRYYFSMKLYATLSTRSRLEISKISDSFYDYTINNILQKRTSFSNDFSITFNYEIF